MLIYYHQQLLFAMPGDTKTRATSFVQRHPRLLGALLALTLLLTQASSAAAGATTLYLIGP